MQYILHVDEEIHQKLNEVLRQNVKKFYNCIKLKVNSIVSV